MSLTQAVSLLRKKRMPPMGSLPEPLLSLATGLAGLRGDFGRGSSLERVLAAMRHKEADRVPVATVTCAAGRQISGISFPDYSLDPDQAARAFVEGFEFAGGDAVILLLDLSVEAADLGQKVIYPLNSTAHPDYDRPFLTGPDDYAKIKPVDVKSAPRMGNYLRLCENVADRVGLSGIIVGFIYGPLGVLSMMRGADNLFKDCALYPDKVKLGCEKVTEVLVDFAEAQCRTGVGAIAIDTLFASRNGLPKKLWEEIEGPFARQISQKIKDMGIVSGVHNCGHDIYFDAQIRSMEPTFISFAHLPDDCATPKEMKRKYGDAITLVGYLPTPLLIHGTPQQVMDECRRQMDDLAAGGGFILAPGCEYPPNIPLTNAIAISRAAEQYGRSYRKAKATA